MGFKIGFKQSENFNRYSCKVGCLLNKIELFRAIIPF